MKSLLRPELMRPAIFGLADGCMSLLGVVLYLHTGLAETVFLSALMGGVSSAASMAGGEYMSDSKNGLGASAVMGIATGIGGILPAVPYAFTTGNLALSLTGIIVVVIGAIVAFMRGKTSEKHGFKYEAVVTFIILAAIFAVVLGCDLVFPSAG